MGFSEFQNIGVPWPLFFDVSIVVMGATTWWWLLQHIEKTYVSINDHKGGEEKMMSHQKNVEEVINIRYEAQKQITDLKLESINKTLVEIKGDIQSTNKLLMKRMDNQ